MTTPETMTVNGRVWVGGQFDLDDVRRAHRSVCAVYEEAAADFREATSRHPFQGMLDREIHALLADSCQSCEPGSTMSIARHAKAHFDAAQSRLDAFKLAEPALHALYYRASIPRFVLEGY